MQAARIDCCIGLPDARRTRRLHQGASVLMHPLDRLHTSLGYARRKHPRFVTGHWHALAVLAEEVAEVAWALIKRDQTNLHEELGHVMAVCHRWLEFVNATQPKPPAQGDAPCTPCPAGPKTLTPPLLAALALALILALPLAWVLAWALVQALTLFLAQALAWPALAALTASPALAAWLWSLR